MLPRQSIEPCIVRENGLKRLPHKSLDSLVMKTELIRKGEETEEILDGSILGKSATTVEKLGILRVTVRYLEVGMKYKSLTVIPIMVDQIEEGIKVTHFLEPTMLGYAIRLGRITPHPEGEEEKDTEVDGAGHVAFYETEADNPPSTFWHLYSPSCCWFDLKVLSASI